MIVNRHVFFLGSSCQIYSTHIFWTDFPVNVKIKTEAQTELKCFLPYSNVFCAVHVIALFAQAVLISMVKIKYMG